MDPIRYAVVGTGWRAQFFVRLADLLPDRFRMTGVVSRSGTSPWDGRVFRDVPALLAADRPEFVVTSVPREVNPALVADLVERGVPVLSETPPAPDVEGMRLLWARVGGSGLVQVAEQYPVLPGHAARSSLVAAGVIGRPTSVHVSSTHLYHAVALVRGLLDVGLAPAHVRAAAFSAPLVDPLTRAGWSDDPQARPATTTIATIDFGAGMGVYDFTDNQWWNPLRARRIVIRGTSGEVVDDRVLRLVAARTPVESALVRRQTGHDLNLEGFDLDHITWNGEVVYRNAYAGARLSDEEIAIATVLERTGLWCRGSGPPPYPLADACQDHLVGLAVEAAAASGTSVRTTDEPWAE